MNLKGITMKNILITGGAGLVGTVLTQGLKDKYNVKILDIKKAEGVESHIGDISNLDSIIPAFKNIDTVVHLAGDRRVHGEWESILDNNIIGLYNIYEAARLSGVKRVIFASSQHATGGFYDVEPYSFISKGEFEKLPNDYKPLDETCRIRPDSFYGASKSFGESISSYYSDFHDISTINIRIGWVISDDDPTFSAFSLTLNVLNFFSEACLLILINYPIYSFNPIFIILIALLIFSELRTNAILTSSLPLSFEL